MVPVLVVLALLVAGAGSAWGDPNTVGMEAYGRGDYARAEQHFREAVRQAPKEPLFHYNLAVTLTQRGRWREAAQIFEGVLRLRPSPEIAAATREALRMLAPVVRPPGRPADDETIALRRVQGVWVADVVLNDTHRARFLVDTGASVCIISPRLAHELGIRSDPDSVEMTLETLGGRISGSVVKIRSISLGDVEAQDVVAVIHETGDAMDGILGNTFLGRYSATIDQRRGVLRLQSK